MAEPVSNELWARADEVKGWLTREEADFLSRLCNGEWCEVGTWKGRSAIILAESGFDGVCIDWFREGNQIAEWQSNLEGYSNVRLIGANFLDVADQVSTINLLHLDADHSLQGTRDAWNLYSPKVEQGGHVVIHDAWPVLDVGFNPWPETTRFVCEVILNDPGWYLAGNAYRSAAFKKL